MKAAFFRTPGPPDVIQYGDLPAPICGPDQCIVQVRAVSVNPIDTYIRNGANFWPLPDPYIVGSDFAGTVIELGSNVKNLAVGERVWASNQGLMGRQGCFAELIAVDSKWLHPTPEGVEDVDVAAIALVAITAHIGLFRRAHLQAKETIFVRGGTGGVGSMVLQMAKAVGAKVITCCGSDLKVQQCLELGADHAFNYNQTQVSDELKRLAPNGVHVFWETLRDPDFDLAVGAMCENGRMVVMAGRDARPAIPVGPFYVKGCSLHGFAMFKSPAEDQMTTASDINHWLSTGQLKSQIDRILPLSETAEAHRLQEAHTLQKQSSLSGKLVLRVE